MWSNRQFVLGFAWLLFSLLSNNISAADSAPDNGTTISTGNSTDGPSETQNAQCTITAGDVRASAQASITTKLEGVCESKAMAESFQILESRLRQELQQLRLMIASLAQQFGHPIQYSVPVSVPMPAPAPVQYYPVPTQAFSSPRPPQQPVVPMQLFPSTTVSTSEDIIFFPPDNEQQSSNINSFKMPPLLKPLPPLAFDSRIDSDSPDPQTTTEKMNVYKVALLKSLESTRSKLKVKKAGLRDFEVHKFNNTILSGGEIKIFTYYWKLEKWLERLESNMTEINSPIFSISGLHLRIRAILNHLSRDYLYLQITKVDENIIEKNTTNVILETGDEYREVETQKFFRHKIVIMDQAFPTRDLISHEFSNTASGFPIPNGAIKASSYSKNDSILIKIIIYL